MLSRLVPYRSDNDIRQLVSQYDEQSFQDMPYWLRETVKARSVTFTRRQPTELEMWETNNDAREHRIMNNEKTLEDYKDKYLHGKSFNILV